MSDDTDVRFLTFAFRDKEIRVCTLGATSVEALLNTHAMELPVRAQLWHPQPGENVIDVGAAHGSYSLTALALGARVLAFEPGKDMLYDLCLSVTANGWWDNFAVMPVLAGDGSSESCSYYPYSHSRRVEGAPEGRAVIAVDTVAYAPWWRKGRVAWLKIDVEGEEMAVLRGAKRTLKEDKPKVLVECHEGIVPGVSEQVWEYMEGLGYHSPTKIVGKGVNDIWVLWEAGQ